MWDFWHGWATYQSCALNSGASMVAVPDPLHPGTTLTYAAPCGWVQEATNLVIAYYGVAIGNYQITFINEHDGLYHSLAAAGPTYTEYSVWDGYGYSEWDCTYTSLLMMLEKETKGQLNLTSPDDVRALVYAMREASGNINPQGPTTAVRDSGGHVVSYPYKWATPTMAGDIVKGASQVFGPGLAVRTYTTWSNVITMLKNGHGVVLTGDYMAWGPQNPANNGQYEPWVADTRFASGASAAPAGHAIYLDRYDPTNDKILMYDPLFDQGRINSVDGTDGSKGIWLPAADLLNFATYTNTSSLLTQPYTWGSPSNITAYYITDPNTINVPLAYRTRPTIGGGSSTVPIDNPQSPADSVVAAQSYALNILGPGEYHYLYLVVNYESSWNPTAVNSSNGACGLGQSNPCSKMSSSIPDWRTQPTAQIKWVLDYITRRYGTPSAAWAHEQAVGWY
jgi:hypothetical protein